MRTLSAFILHLSLAFVSFQCLSLEPVKSAVPLDIVEPGVVGAIAEFEGKVMFHKGKSVRGRSVKLPGKELHELDRLRTKSDSWVLIKLLDGSRVMLQEKSVIRFHTQKEMGVEAGQILFDIKKQGDINGLRVSTKTAVIGVKGTTFMVSEHKGNTDVFLQEGILEVDAKEGEFKKFGKPETEDDFRNEFERYKQQVNEEFSEYVKQIRMEGGTAISISNNKEVRDVDISDEMREKFARFAGFQ